MRVGDLVKRRNPWMYVEYSPQNHDGEMGVIISLQPGGRNPVHPCAKVFYPGKGKMYDIAVSPLEVISESW